MPSCDTAKYTLYIVLHLTRHSICVRRYKWLWKSLFIHFCRKRTCLYLQRLYHLISYVSDIYILEWMSGTWSHIRFTMIIYVKGGWLCYSVLHILMEFILIRENRICVCVCVFGLSDKQELRSDHVPTGNDLNNTR